MGKRTIGDTESSRRIYDAIQAIAMHGYANPENGAWYGASRVIGFVAKIHDSGDLAGTIDVQEFNNGGYHQGVLLTAIQNNKSGLVVIPKLYSEVVVALDAALNKEFVSLYSHADMVQIRTHNETSIGAVETKPYTLEDDVEMDDLKPTGNAAEARFSSSSPKAEVYATDSDGHKGRVEVTPGQVVVESEGGSNIRVNEDKVTISASETLIGGENANHPAVLGDKLAEILEDMLKYLSSMTTTTQLGPQPPINLSSYVALYAKVKSFKEMTSGFLTPNVKIKE